LLRDEFKQGGRQAGKLVEKEGLQQKQKKKLKKFQAAWSEKERTMLLGQIS